MDRRRFVNLLREAHRTARATPVLYPLVFPLVVAVLIPFFVVEPDAFDHEDHV